MAVIANQRGVIKGQPGERPRFGGIVYTGSAEKVAFFIETANRERLPLLFIQDVSGFMVGPEAEQSGIIRAGARFVEAMATAVVPKIVLTVNHASGAGYYAMAGQGFDPDFLLSWPTGRMGVMEGESAVMAVHGAEIEKSRREGREPSAEVKASMSSMRADYEEQLDAKYAGARGFLDAIVTPEETRDQLAFALRIAANYAGPHLGPFVLPPLDAATYPLGAACLGVSRSPCWRWGSPVLPRRRSRSSPPRIARCPNRISIPAGCRRSHLPRQSPRSRIHMTASSPWYHPTPRLLTAGCRSQAPVSTTS